MKTSSRSIRGGIAALALGASFLLGMGFGSAASAADGDLLRWMQALEKKLDRVLENQKTILDRLDRIWKYK